MRLAVNARLFVHHKRYRKSLSARAALQRRRQFREAQVMTSTIPTIYVTREAASAVDDVDSPAIRISDSSLDGGFRFQPSATAISIKIRPDAQGNRLDRNELEL